LIHISILEFLYLQPRMARRNVSAYQTFNILSISICEPKQKHATYRDHHYFKVLHFNSNLRFFDMCKYSYHKSKCGHQWLEIITPCSPGMGFSTCRMFFGERGLVPVGPGYRSSIVFCPECGLRVYDGNQVRMIEKIRRNAGCVIQ
jgi:hypothetical protein